MNTYPIPAIPAEPPKTAAEVQGALLVAAELDTAAESLKAHAESLTDAAVAAVQVLPMAEVQELSPEHRNELLARLLAKGVEESIAKAMPRSSPACCSIPTRACARLPTDAEWAAIFAWLDAHGWDALGSPAFYAWHASELAKRTRILIN